MTLEQFIGRKQIPYDPLVVVGSAKQIQLMDSMGRSLSECANSHFACLSFTREEQTECSFVFREGGKGAVESESGMKRDAWIKEQPGASSVMVWPVRTSISIT